MSDDVSKEIGGVVLVQSAFEPWPRWFVKVGPVALFLYVKLSSIGIGIGLLSAGIMIQVGPVLFGAAHIKKQTAAFDRMKEPNDA